MALSPLFWNNGWSSQLSLSLDSLIPLMHCAVRPCGGLLIGGVEKKKKNEKPAGISEMLSKGLRHGCILYSAAYLIVSFSVLLPYFSLCKKKQQQMRV